MVAVGAVIGAVAAFAVVFWLPNIIATIRLARYAWNINHSLTKADKRLIIRRVTKNFVDPDSARFRWLVQKPNQVFYCGMVNAKNGLGGYVGYSLFMVGLGRDNTGEVDKVYYYGVAAPGSSDPDWIINECKKMGVTTDTAEEGGN